MIPGGCVAGDERKPRKNQRSLFPLAGYTFHRQSLSVEDTRSEAQVVLA